MTCIVGVIDKKENKVYIGGDSAGVAGLNVTIRKDEKVFRVGEFVIGCTSSFRMMQLIRFSFTPPAIPEGMELFNYMCTHFMNALRECLKAGGYAKKTNEEESGGTFLVAYKDRLFEIESDYQVGESIDPFAAVGCGDQYALGALATAYDNVPTRQLIEGALKVATHFSAGVRPPFVIEHT